MRLKFKAKLLNGGQGKLYIYIPKALYPNLDTGKRYMVTLEEIRDETESP